MNKQLLESMVDDVMTAVHLKIRSLDLDTDCQIRQAIRSKIAYAYETGKDLGIALGETS